MAALILAFLLALAPAATLEPTLRPFADYEETGYLIMSAFDGHGAAELKRELVRQLPPDVSLVLYGPSARTEDRLKILQDYGRFIASDRLVYVALPGAKNGFWSRDALPLPFFDAAQGLVLTDARYWTGFEPDARVGQLFAARVVRHKYQFEGGNFMANHLGECFIVRTRLSDKIANDVFTNQYGCRNLTRLPKRGGIGHVDERARFVDAATIVTDTPEYEPVFTSRGFRTVRLPRPAGKYGTYVNALFVNRRVFVPQFGLASDEEAVRIYRDLGLTVVGLDSRALSSSGQGSIHCLAMNYPRVPLAGPASGGGRAFQARRAGRD